jgi:nitrogen fixation protein NifU and related proteins
MAADTTMNMTSPRSFTEHSPHFQEMVSRIERYGTIDKPDGYGKRTSACGDIIEFFLAVRNDRLQMITFKVGGCANTVACTNTVSLLMEGQTLADAWQLTQEQVIDYLETLAPDQYHCAELAVGAFFNALADCNRRRKEPWKKPYLSR